MEILEVIDLLNKMHDEGLIKVLIWETRELILLPKTESKIIHPIEEWIDVYRNLFKGKKPGAMGDKNACIVKMKELFLRRPDLSMDKVIRATEKYIQVESNQRWKYLMQADYFISKNQGNTRDGRVSKLEAYCDELDTNEPQNSFIHDI